MIKYILHKLYGNNIDKEFELQNFSDKEKAAIVKKMDERLQTVILQTAVSLMNEEQFKSFQSIVENETDEQKAQEALSNFFQQIPKLSEQLQKNIASEITALKKIIKSN